MPPKPGTRQKDEEDPNTLLLAEKDVRIKTLLEAADRHAELEARLTQENNELAIQLSSCQKDLQDINEFLLNELKVQSLITADLEDRVKTASRRHDEDLSSHQAALQNAKEEAKEGMQMLEAKIQALQGRSAEVNAFLQEKAIMLKRAADLEALLDAERIAAGRKLSELEQQGLDDLEKVRKDMATKVRQAHEDATNTAGGQALVQSRLLQHQLQEQSIQMGRLVSRSAELTAHNGALLRKLHALEELYAALVRRSHACQKAIQSLIVSNTNLSAEQADCTTTLEKAAEEAEAIKEQLRGKDDALDIMNSELRDKSVALEAAEERLSVTGELCAELAEALSKSFPAHSTEGAELQAIQQLLQHILDSGGLGVEKPSGAVAGVTLKLDGLPSSMLNRGRHLH